VIPADLAAELATAVGELVAAGHLPASALTLSAAGTWRPAPDAGSDSPAPDAVAGAEAARYATSLPFELAAMAGQEPFEVAARLGLAVQRAGWITSAGPTGSGYLTIGVTAAALAAVAVRTSQAGPACVRSEALRSVSRPVPPMPDLAAALTWRQAWRDQAAAMAGRLAEAAGATALPSSPGPAGPAAAALPSGHGLAGPAAAAALPFGRGLAGPARAAGREPGRERAGAGPAGRSTVAHAVDFVGADAVRYWLARLPAARAGILDRAVSATRAPARPGDAAALPARPRDAAAGRRAHDARPSHARAPDSRAPGAPAPAPRAPYGRAPDARAPDARAPDAPAPAPRPPDAPSYSDPPVLARDLGAVLFAAADAAATGRWAAELGLARLGPAVAGDELGQPAEIALLTELSWLAERVAGAARRRRPDELPRYLERLAGAWLDVREGCPALPFGGRAAPGGAAGISARLWLAEATATALAAGLDLVGIRP
jgi:hypothetical protein